MILLEIAVVIEERIIKKIIEKIIGVSRRWFPERQMYFRTNGVVRFVSISERAQIGISLLAIMAVSWVGVASYHYIFTSDIMAGKDREIATGHNNYQNLDSQFNQMKNDIEKTARSLEQRQVYLQQLLDADKSLENLKNENRPDHPAASTSGKSSFLLKEDEKYKVRAQILENMRFDLKHIEDKQARMAALMIERVSRKLAYVEKTLKKSGIKTDKLITLAANMPATGFAQGGPFIMYHEVPELNISENEPFARLYAKHSRLLNLQSAIQSLPVTIPVKKYYISSGYGTRKDPFRKTWARHSGLDMAGWWKTPIYASANGKVVKAGKNGAYGNFIEIDHGNGFRSRYGHLSKIQVKKGQQVINEQQIGLMGSTGRSTSPHLHYEIWFDGKPTNPMKIFKAAEDVLKIQRQEYDS